MFAVEFQATLRNGMILVPPQYQATLPAQVRVIVLPTAVEHAEENDDIIARLSASPRTVRNFEPMAREEVHER